MDIVGFLVVLGISARLTRLVTHDEIMQPLRTKAGTGWIGFMIHCPWCVGLWITGAVTLTYALLPEPGREAAAWAAAALAANLLWALAQDAYDTVQELHRERTLALAQPQPGPPRGRGARHPHQHAAQE